MAPPTNTSAGTATVIASLPYSTTQNVYDAGTAYTVWYRYTAVAGDTELGLFAFGDLTIYVVHASVLSPDGSTAYPPDTPVIGTNKPIQFPVTAGVTYYFQFAPGSSAATPALLTLSVYRHPGGAVPAGTFAIQDDSPGLPLALVSAADGSVLRFIPGVPGGDYSTNIAASGAMIFADAFTDDLAVYDAAFTRVATISNPFSTGSLKVASDRVDTFYVGTPGGGATHASVTTISAAGVVGPTTWTLAAVGLIALTPNLAETILYYTNTAVHRWDLVHNVALSDLAFPAGAFSAGKDLLVLADDTLLTVFNTPAITIYHLATDGSVLHSYAAPAGATGANTRLAWAADDPASFWVWTKHGGATAKFTHMRISDGATLATVTGIMFTGGVYDGAATATPPASFGFSSSCAFFLTPGAVVGGDPGTIVVTKATDAADPTSFAFTATGMTPGAFTLADGSAQTFSVTPGSGYAVAETPTPGWSSTWSVSNGSAISNLVVTAGETVTVAFTNHLFAATTYPLRRSRVFVLPFDQDYSIFLTRVEYFLQVGDSADAPIYTRFSKDGGRTWGAWITLTAGAVGDYRKRVYVNRVGLGRNWVGQIVVDAPVPWYLIDAYVEIEEGTA